MSTTLTGRIQLVLQHTLTNVVNIGTPQDSFRLSLLREFTNGNAINQAEQVYYDQRSLAATSENLDLSGVLLNPFGNLVAFVKIKSLTIVNLTTTVGANLIIGGAASNAWTGPFGDSSDKITVGPGGILHLCAPAASAYLVTAGSADILKIDSGAATISYQIHIIGTITELTTTEEGTTTT